MLHHNYVSINANRILAARTDFFTMTDYLRVNYMTVIYSSIKGYRTSKKEGKQINRGWDEPWLPVL